MASYEKRDNGTWSVRFRYTNKGTLANKRMSGYRTKKDAEKAYSEFILSHDFSPSAMGDKTFEEMFNLFSDFQSERTKESSTFNRLQMYRSNIKDFMGTKTLNSISALTIADFQSYLNKQNYSYEYKRKTLGVVSSVFKYAIKYYDYTINPVEKADKLRRFNEPRTEKQVWSIENFAQFINEENEEPYRTLFLFLYETGCRKGEALALYWSDVDLINGTVSINKTYSRKTTNSVYKIDETPKTQSSNRTIILPQILIDSLTQLKQNCCGKFVFYNDKPIPETSLRYRFKVDIEKANKQERKIPDITIHELRHSHASLLISQGVSIVTVSKRLGHANIQETLNIYSHLMPNDDKKAVDILNKLGTNLGTEKIR